MLNKIYLGLLAIAFLVMAFFTYYSWSWLQSIGDPSAVIENFDFHSELSWVFLWISAVVLLVVGNAILWISRRSWAMWAAAAYFSVFVLIKYFWLDQGFLVFKKAHGMSNGSFDLGPFLAVTLCLIAGGIVFFDQFIIVRLVEKMHPVQLVETSEADESPTKSES